jgi:hypothetical protein
MLTKILETKCQVLDSNKTPRLVYSSSQLSASVKNCKTDSQVSHRKRLFTNQVFISIFLLKKCWIKKDLWI